jgi:hypothetical protein
MYSIINIAFRNFLGWANTRPGWQWKRLRHFQRAKLVSQTLIVKLGRFIA